MARFIRLADRPGVADAALTVVDDAQRKGLGRVLFTRLVAAARERGIERFSFDIQASNDGMRGLIRSISPDAVDHPQGPLVTVDMPLPSAEVPPDVMSGNLRGNLLHRLRALIGRG